MIAIKVINVTNRTRKQHTPGQSQTPVVTSAEELLPVVVEKVINMRTLINPRKQATPTLRSLLVHI